MKKHIGFSAVILLATWTVANAAQAQFTINLPGFGLSLPAPPGVGINIGLPVAPAAPYPYQPVAAAPAYPYDYEALDLAAPPDFVEPPELGFYVAVGVPFDLFFFNNMYYLYRNDCWYSSRYYNGPWSGIYHRNVPYALHRYPFERIHHYRDNYYGHYRRYGTWNGGTHFRPGAHALGREGYDRNRSGYARPNDYGRSFENRAPYSRPSYNRVYNGPNQFHGTRPDTTRTYAPAQSYGNRAADFRQDRPAQSLSGRPAFNRPDNTGQGFGNRAAYTRPYGQTQSFGNRVTYSRPMNANQGFGNRPSFSRPDSGGQVFQNRPSFSNPNNAGRSFGSKAEFARPQSPRQGSLDRGRGGFGNGGFGGHERGR